MTLVSRTILASLFLQLSISLAAHAGDSTETPSIDLVAHSHTAVNVSDMDRTLAWYKKVLGMKVLFDEAITGEGIDEVFGEKGTKLRLAKGTLADTVVEFIEIQHRKTAPHPTVPGVLGMMGSITFYVKDLEQARQRAAALGVEVPAALTNIMGTYVFAIRDPDGTVVEFNQAH